MTSMYAEKILEGICTMKNSSPPSLQPINRSTDTSRYLLEDYLLETFSSSKTEMSMDVSTIYMVFGLPASDQP